MISQELLKICQCRSSRPVAFGSASGGAILRGLPPARGAAWHRAGPARQLGQAPQVAPDDVGLLRAGWGFDVAVDPGGVESEALGRADVVLEAEGDVQDALGWLADLLQQVAEALFGRFVGPDILSHDDPLEGKVEMPQRVRH